MTSSSAHSQWWVGFAEQALAYLPPAAEDKLKHSLSYLLPLTELRVPVAMLRGSAQPAGRPATMLVAGAERWIDYLPGRFFAGTPEREVVGHAPVWKLPRLLSRLMPSVDLTIARVDRISARLFFDDDYLTVPDWVGMTLAVPIDLAVLARTNASVAEDIRVTRRRWPESDVSHAATDFDEFYRRLYLPYTRCRHGPEAHVWGAQRLRRAFRRGGVLWVRRDGQRLAGDLFERKNDTLDLLALGVADGDVELLKQGVVAALYVHIIEYAREQGCAAIDMRGSRPSLRDGLLRYKRKWGAALYDKRDEFHSTLVRWNRLDGVVAEFLSHTPLIFRDGDAMSGVGVVDRQARWTEADLQQVHDKLWIPGLRRLCLLSSAEQPADLRLPADTRLIDIKRLGDAGPRALLAAINETAKGQEPPSDVGEGSVGSEMAVR